MNQRGEIPVWIPLLLLMIIGVIALVIIFFGPATTTPTSTLTSPNPTTDTAETPPTDTPTPTPTPTPTSTYTPPPTTPPSPPATEETPTPTTPPPTSTPVPPSPTPLPTSPIIYSAPALLEPQNGAQFNNGFFVFWEWKGQLEENEYFAVRVYPKGEPEHSVVWTRDKGYFVAFYGAPEGDYCWHVVILRGTGPEDWVQISPKSEERCFYASWPSEAPLTSQPQPTTDIDDVQPTDRS